MTETKLEGRVDKTPDSSTSGRRKHGAFRKYQRFTLGLAAVATVLVAWQICADTNVVDSTFSGSPTGILAATYDYFAHGSGFTDLKVSGTEFVVGMAISFVVGVPLGLLIGWSRIFSAITEPFLYLAYAMPTIALGPLFILWFGIGLESKVAMVVLMSIIPILISTSTGVKTTEKSLLNVARVFEANDLQILRTLVLPGSIPTILAGLRIGTGLGLIGVVVGELLASTEGIGFSMNSAGSNFEVNLLFATLLVIAVAGLILSSLLRLIERRFEAWRL